MGYISHDAIIVTGWDKEKLEVARSKAVELELPVSEIVDSEINGYVSFLIAPDGSKEGWAESDAGDEKRDEWKRLVREQERLWIDWVHVVYGGDTPEACLVDTDRDEDGE